MSGSGKGRDTSTQEDGDDAHSDGSDADERYSGNVEITGEGGEPEPVNPAKEDRVSNHEDIVKFVFKSR